jgi:HJR/Mrr/RecB family endonuclease
LMSDKGVDVVVFPKKEDEQGIIIQAKHSQLDRRTGTEAVQEIVAARLWFEQKYDVKFSMAAATNTGFSENARTLAAVNGVELYERAWLRKQLETQGVTHTDVNLCELGRESAV